jgi:molybdopterin-biosynthesis enzyme MoeA-like protein
VSARGFGAYVIGDEILVGKRQDKHFPWLIGALAQRGLRLAWCEHLGDEPARITAALRRTFATDDVVFSFGGIGATPDDHTRQCAAEALGVPLALHPEAEAEIRGRFGAETTPQRLKMGEFPAGCAIVPNPFNRIPGFSVGHHYFVPGFPQMAWPMVEWVLDEKYRPLFDSQRWGEASILVYGLPESSISPLMEEVNAAFPGLKTFSLPSMGEGGTRRHIELGVRGAPDQVAPAMERLRSGVTTLGGTADIPNR